MHGMGGASAVERDVNSDVMHVSHPARGGVRSGTGGKSSLHDLVKDRRVELLLDGLTHRQRFSKKQNYGFAAT